jgi:hypothetical protein
MLLHGRQVEQAGRPHKSFRPAGGNGRLPERLSNGPAWQRGTLRANGQEQRRRASTVPKSDPQRSQGRIGENSTV